MPERKNDGILSSNVKKLIILHFVLKTNQILQYGSLVFFMQFILKPIWRENLPKYGRAITRSILDTVLTTVFGASILSKDSLMYLSTKSRG